MPALGDFASRRLPAAFIGPWDAWLQRGIAASRATLRERWLDIYLNGPLWNFALLPGVCGDGAWLGTIMPSVDRVGRHFPLTIALAVPAHATILHTMAAARDWFAAIDRAALACLDLHHLPEQLEMRLAELPFPEQPAMNGRPGSWLDAWLSAQANEALVLHLPAGISAADVFGAAAAGPIGAGIGGNSGNNTGNYSGNNSGNNSGNGSGGGRSIWWSDTTSSAATRLLAFHGLPDDDEFTLLLDDPGGAPP